MVMVTSVTNVGRSGLSDWLVQRVSAVVLLVYIGFLLSFFVCNPDLGYWDLKAFFGRTSVQVFSTLALLATVVHAWIGGWSVLTDYVTARFFRLELGINIGSGRALALRMTLQILGILLMLIYTLWGIKILWGV